MNNLMNCVKMAQKNEQKDKYGIGQKEINNNGWNGKTIKKNWATENGRIFPITTGILPNKTYFVQFFFDNSCPFSYVVIGNVCRYLIDEIF